MLSMEEKNCDICYRIICKRCGWVASAEEVSDIQCGRMTACPECGWKPGDLI
jgi:hypothetical protein